jgi:sugar lactone lactonase YvrE
MKKALIILSLILFPLGCGIGSKPNNLKTGRIAYKVKQDSFALAIDASNNIWVLSDNALTKVSSEGILLETHDNYASSNDIAIDAGGNVWIPAGRGVLVELDTSGTYTTYTVENVIYEESIVIDEQGDILVGGYTQSCTTGASLSVCSSSNGIITKLTSNGMTLGTYDVGNYIPNAIAIDASNNIWVAGSAFSCNGYSSGFSGGTITEAVIELNQNGITMGTYIIDSYPCNGNYLTLILNGRPTNMDIDPSGNVWVANRLTETVTKLSSTGVTLGTYSAGGGAHYGMGIDSDGNVWVTNYYTNGGAVTEIGPDGTELKSYSVDTIPIGIAIDAAGNVWTTYGDGVTKLIDVAKGPQYFPYKGPQFP